MNPRAPAKPAPITAEGTAAPAVEEAVAASEAVDAERPALVVRVVSRRLDCWEVTASAAEELAPRMLEILEETVALTLVPLAELMMAPLGPVARMGADVMEARSDETEAGTETGESVAVAAGPRR